MLILHTFNLVTDYIESIVLTVLMHKGPLEGKRFVDVAENCGYWNFVVVTWIPIYLVVYWAPEVLTCASGGRSCSHPSSRWRTSRSPTPPRDGRARTSNPCDSRAPCAVSSRLHRRRSRWPLGLWREPLRRGVDERQRVRHFLAGVGVASATLAAAVVAAMWIGARSCRHAWPEPLAALAGAGARSARGRTTRRRRVRVEPGRFACLVVSVVLYATGVARLWKKAGPARGIGAGTVARFAAGWLAAVRGAPAAARGRHPERTSRRTCCSTSSSWWSRRRCSCGRGRSRRGRGRCGAMGAGALGDAVRSRWLRRLWGAITEPVGAWCLHAIAIWAWHIPSLSRRRSPTPASTSSSTRASSRPRCSSGGR
jgi:hypothetical protein